MPKDAPILINEEVVKPTKFGNPKTVRPRRQRKKLSWNRFIEFDFKQTKEKIRFAVTYVLVGIAFFFVADIFRLVTFKTTAGIMVFVGIVSIIVAFVIPIVQLVRDYEEAEHQRRRDRYR